MTFDEQHEAFQERCEATLTNISGRFFTPLSKVSEAADYSLLSGGKRVRGVLVQAVCEMLDGDFRAADTFAAALEMIHAFSLVHDDLPCMDDDDVRRGKPANHIVYGEANALLAGDLLAIEAFEVIASASFAPDLRAGGVAVLAAAAGARGMIYGQELDLKYEKEPADEAALLQIHRNKTGALILAGAQLGILAAGAPLESHPMVTRYAEKIGLAFQVVDDILDATATTETLGKPVGSDAEQHKTTFVSMIGLEKSRERALLLTEQAIAGVAEAYGKKAWFLTEFARRLAARVS